jgi:hypothetical protein
MREPEHIVAELERTATLPVSEDECFAGYGAAQTFAGGEVLCLRRWPASSIGPAYTSIWHRDAAGQWTFVQDAQATQACSRYFGAAIVRSLTDEIRIDWSGPRQFRVVATGSYPVDWRASVSNTAATRVLNAVAAALPRAFWRSERALQSVSAAARLVLGSGRLNLTGVVPNGQRFISNPSLMWTIVSSEATVCGRSLGPVGPLPVQARLADIWIPQRGQFFVGRAFLEPFDPSRHSSVTSQHTAETSAGARPSS